MCACVEPGSATNKYIALANLRGCSLLSFYHNEKVQTYYARLYPQRHLLRSVAISFCFRFSFDSIDAASTVMSKIGRTAVNVKLLSAPCFWRLFGGFVHFCFCGRRCYCCLPACLLGGKPVNAVALRRACRIFSLLFLVSNV